MSAAPAAKAAQGAPRRFAIGERRPVELRILRSGEIRMKGPGTAKVLVTSVANVFYAALRSASLTDIRQRQRRAAVLTTGGRR